VMEHTGGIETGATGNGKTVSSRKDERQKLFIYLWTSLCPPAVGSGQDFWLRRHVIMNIIKLGLFSAALT
jgi:hypothetical protein